ncbi:hypothetical protein GA0115240_11504 [Streptomyces sp. DvalAA-14]|nr:hypothetical protein GA0115240_11504 [Streptomyces sp. DvalAA-14]
MTATTEPEPAGEQEDAGYRHVGVDTICKRCGAQGRSFS